MRRAGVVALLGTVCAGLVALALVAARDERELAFTTGVVPTTVAAELRPGATVCQTPIAVPEEFDRVRLRAGRAGAAGRPLAVDVRSADFKRELGSGRLPGGWWGITEQDVSVGRVPPGERIAVCIRNAGRRSTALYGNTAAAAPISGAYVRGRVLDTDLTLVFLRRERRSMLSLLPELFERASVFRPGWGGPWVYWLLTAAALVGVPVLLARALARTEDAP